MKQMETHTLDINQLLQERGANDSGVIESLFSSYYPVLFRLAQSILNDPAEAADAAQDAFIAIAARLDSYQAGTNLRAWIYTIGVNTCRSYLRKRRSRQNLQAVLQRIHFFSKERTDPEESALRSEKGRELWGMVDRLGEKHRLVVILHFVHDLPIKEVAQVLGIPEKTTYTRLYDALRKLRQQVG